MISADLPNKIKFLSSYYTFPFVIENNVQYIIKTYFIFLYQKAVVAACRCVVCIEKNISFVEKI